MKRIFEKHFRLIGAIGSFIALGVAVIYLVVIPEEASSVEGIHKVVLVYAHSACWILLGCASMVWAVKGKNKISVALAYAALAAYVAFMVALVAAKA